MSGKRFCMVEPRVHMPTLISIVGVDGSGKSTLASWLIDTLKREGYHSTLVWSRFRNYLSKPLLALTRLTGHNHYETLDGIRFGFHDFNNLVGYRELFAVLQAVDVNIAAYSRITRRRRTNDVVVCERGPWDTLVDVIADTGLTWLTESALGRSYSALVRRDAIVLWIARDLERILDTRPELRHDQKLPGRIESYRRLADRYGWRVIDNNGTLEHTQQQICDELALCKLTNKCCSNADTSDNHET